MLGAFNTGVIPTSTDYNILIYFIWLLCTFMVFIVMLNMLIALIGGIFDKIHEKMNNNLLKELVVLMVESELLISRSKLFEENKKYIIVVKKEKGEVGSVGADSKLGIIKMKMGKKISEQRNMVERITKNLEK